MEEHITPADLAAALSAGIKAGLLGEGFAYEAWSNGHRGPYALVPEPEVHRLMAEHFQIPTGDTQ